ncbi:hypothetical protein BDB13_6287 [Rhodococcus sp. OK302]|nr:hypothetical protein BDB13_6287 [Rhodococcus sp. OK302]
MGGLGETTRWVSVVASLLVLVMHMIGIELRCMHDSC